MMILKLAVSVACRVHTHALSRHPGHTLLISRRIKGTVKVGAVNSPPCACTHHGSEGQCSKFQKQCNLLCGLGALEPHPDCDWWTYSIYTQEPKYPTFV